MRSILKSAFIFLLFSLLFISCKREAGPRIYLDGTFSYSFCQLDSDISEADKNEYFPLELSGYRNLQKTIGKNNEYIWLRTSFVIPEELKEQDLAMVIPYLHYASELYLNGMFIDDYGFMEEPRQEAGFTAQLFDFPEFFLNPDGENVIHIKVLLFGQSTISQKVFVGLREDAWAQSDIHSFWQSRIYIFFIGILLGVFITFLILYIANPKYLHYLFFSLLSLASVLFFANFFSGDLPFVGFHGGIPFFIFIKITRCVSFFAMENFFVLFVISFLQVKHHKIEIVARILVSFFCAILVSFAKDYETLIKITMPLVMITSIDILAAVGLIIKCLFSKFETQKSRASFLVSAFLPLLIAFISDGIIKLVFNNILITYLSLPAYIFSIVLVFIYFALDYKRISIRLEYLNRSLEDEVEIQTRRLVETNEKLEAEQEITQEDMSMAALVQKKIFHAPATPLDNWEIAVRYEPLSIVSGDLFNFYTIDNTLDGLALFDASGHGVAASLVTMLAENIIRQTYYRMSGSNKSVAEILTEINDRFIDAKDDIENYLTGILLSSTENEDGSCTIRMANAGHPNPVIYKAEEGIVDEILPDVSSPSYGAVGMKGFDVCYSEIDFTMKSGDVLLLYTDGLIEMKNENNEEFGMNRIMTVLSEIHGMSAHEMISALMFAFNAHVYSVPRTDDVSVIILKRK